VLLDIFDFRRKDEDCTIHYLGTWNTWEWHILVHVCRRWRQIVFASPLRLSLRIPCTPKTPIRKNLGIWPAFPIDVYDDLEPDIMDGNGILQPDIIYGNNNVQATYGNNILAALRHSDRVCHVRLMVSQHQLESIATAMQVPFPMLTQLYLTSHSWCDGTLALPAGFLEGIAPCLQAIGLSGIACPTLPTIVLSTSNLVKLELSSLFPNGYISPEAIVASLAVLPRLEIFIIKFRPATSPDRISSHPVPRTTLPSLAFFVFRGTSKYLEDLVGGIDCPRLHHISIVYLDEVSFQAVQLSKFIDRSVGPRLTKCQHAEIRFARDGVTYTFKFSHRASDPGQDKQPPTTVISCQRLYWSLSQVLGQFPAPLSNTVHLELENDPENKYVDARIEWLHFLHQFSTVQTLLVHRDLAGHVALVLRTITEEMATELLPSLELICLEGKWPPLIDNFVAPRRHFGLPVAVINTRKEFRERRESYIRP
jgi:hypothetical protein